MFTDYCLSVTLILMDARDAFRSSLPVKEPDAVVVAMSGGVDSSVSAALFKKHGWDVIGAHFVLPCSAEKRKERKESVRRVANHIRIPLELLDLEKVFAERVLNPFIDQYLLGLTPNPCVVCNETIKFRHLLAFAEDRGIRFLATGHYARVLREESSLELRRGLDPGKEQSYFLQRLNRGQLSRTLFPLGRLSKDEVRGIAEALKLPVPRGSESQEICFVPDNDYRSFLHSMRGKTIAQVGPISDKNGEKLGEHSGTYGYTIGQRHGLGIASPRPYYVMEIRAEENRLVVGRKEDLYSSIAEAEGASWISGEPPEESESLLAQVRYRHRPAPGRLRIPTAGRILFEFEEPQWAVTPGQALAIYCGERLLGGGWIKSAAG